MKRVCCSYVGLVLGLLGVVVHRHTGASEFPERECCDPVYPLPAPPVSTTPFPSAATPTGRSAPFRLRRSSVLAHQHNAEACKAVSCSHGPQHDIGPNVKTAVAILNCLLARQLCFEDASCSAILEIIPRVCGPELVACSTVTVTKCQAALRTLQAFPFFRPTCLCREPQHDPECNSFRDFLFDHPCIFVHKKEKDPYPVDALPTCNHALSVCQQERKCIKLYEDFKANCKVREQTCRMEDRDLCHDAWTKLRLSPMFGCICPNNHMKRRCDRIFSMVNHNPCVVKVISSENATSFDVIELQLENPLVGIRGGSTKDVSGHHSKEINGIPSNDNSILDEDGEPRRTIFSHHQPGNPILHSSGEADTEVPRNFSFQSTCHLALEMCNSNRSCRVALQPVMHFCDASRCNRETCMEKLQSFYRSADLRWSLEIAFCLCKKTENKQDECLVAQERLHPVCAQRVEGTTIPTCHSLAEECREEHSCRNRLEYYEQSCAVDSVTKKCAGPPAECRKAMLGILGTELRANCACKGTDFTQLYDCLGWQRLLWVNPCVVESQKDFHTKRSTDSSHSTAAAPTHSAPATSAWPAAGLSGRGGSRHDVSGSGSGGGSSSYGVADGEPPFGSSSSGIYNGGVAVLPEIVTPAAPHPTRSLAPVGPAPTSPGPALAAAGLSPGGSELAPGVWHTSDPPSSIFTPGPTTPTTPSTTTTPPKYCVVQRPHQADQYIPEGRGRRLYREDEPDCSELCQCSEGEQLVCNTVCVERAPCKTDFAFYNHAAPAYQAYRGRCLCYSGRFICMRPAPDSYHLPQGVFLFLGYSETDEALLRPHSNLTVRDAVGSLQEFMRTESGCSLSVYNVTKENLILMARLGREDDDTPPSTDNLVREKEECAGPLQDISNKINSHHPELHSHLLLSIFKMAEVEVKVPETSGASRPPPAPSAVTAAAAVAILLLLLVAPLHILAPAPARGPSHAATPVAS